MDNTHLKDCLGKMLRFVRQPSCDPDTVLHLVKDVANNFHDEPWTDVIQQLVDVMDDAGPICLDLIDSLVASPRLLSISSIARMITIPCQIVCAGSLSLASSTSSDDSEIQCMIALTNAMKWVTDWAGPHESLEMLRTLLVNNGAMLVTNMWRSVHDVAEWTEKLRQLPPMYLQRLLLLFCRQPSDLCEPAVIICDAFTTGCRRICEEAMRQNTGGMEIVYTLLCPCMAYLCKLQLREGSGMRMHSPLRLLAYTSAYRSVSITNLHPSETRLPVLSDRRLLSDLARLTKIGDLPDGVRFWTIIDLSLDVLKAWRSPCVTCTVTQLNNGTFSVHKDSFGNFTHDMQSCLISILRIIVSHGQQAMQKQMHWKQAMKKHATHSNQHSSNTQPQHHLGGHIYEGYVQQQVLEFPHNRLNMFDLLLLTSCFMEFGLHKQLNYPSPRNRLQQSLHPGVVLASESLLRNICEMHSQLVITGTHASIFVVSAFACDATLDACMSILATAHKLMDSDNGTDEQVAQTRVFCLRLFSKVLFETAPDLLLTNRWRNFLLLASSVLTAACAGYRLSELGSDIPYVLKMLPSEVKGWVIPLLQFPRIPSKLVQSMTWSRADYMMGLLPGCSNWMCKNLAGCAESVLPTWKCTGCRQRYCCKACQKHAWRNGHSVVCNV